MMPLAYRASRATWWSAMEIGARYGVQFVVTVVLARLLIPSDFGLLAMLLVFTALGSVLADAGFGTALIQRPAIQARDQTTVFCINMAAAVALGSLLWSCSDAIAAFYRQPQLAGLARAMAWVLPLSAFGAVPDAMLTRRLDFKARAYAQLLASVISGLLGVGLALRGMGVWSLVVQTLAAAGTRSIALWFFSGWRPSGGFSWTSLRELFRFGGYLLLSGILNVASTRIQLLALGRLFDAGTLGYYTLAQNGADVPKGLMGAMLGRVGLPVFSEISHDNVALHAALRRALRLSMFLFMPAMLGIALAAEPLVVLVYGVQWAKAAPVLALLAIAGTLWPLHVLNLAALTAQGRSDRFLILELVKNVSIICLTVLAARWGALGMAAAMVVASIISAVINTWYTRRMLGYGLLAQLAEQWPTFLMSVVALVPAWVILHGAAHSVSRIIVAIGSAALAYALLAVATRCPAWLDLHRMIGHLARHSPPSGGPVA